VSAVVIFRSRRTAAHGDEYESLSARMQELVQDHPGFIEMASVRDPMTREGITVAYFEDEASIRAWKGQAEHAEAQRRGIAALYEDYHVTVAQVTRQYGATPEGNAAGRPHGPGSRGSVR
jgi:heme-degrading monooxygenase HmoA